MEDRKWENMITDCLVNIFGRLPMRSRFQDVPLVCKAWFRAVSNPLCWQTLDFSCFFDLSRKVSERIISQRIDRITLAVKLSKRCATTLLLWNCTREELIFISEECPGLKTLSLSNLVCHKYSDIIPSLIVKWKNLEFLSLVGSYCLLDVLKVISIHLPSFTGLFITMAPIEEEIASAIVSLLPTLKFLTINRSIVLKENLLIILRGCKELVSLDVRKCIGFDEDDEEILKLSSVIKNFRCDGSYTLKNFRCDGSYTLEPLESYDFYNHGDVVYLYEESDCDSD